MTGAKDKYKGGPARGSSQGLGTAGVTAESSGVTAELMAEANWGQSQAAVGGTTQGGCVCARLLHCRRKAEANVTGQWNSSQPRERTDSCHVWSNFENVVLSETSHTRKATGHPIPRPRNVWKRQDQGDRKRGAVGAWGLGEERGVTGSSAATLLF